MNLGYAMLAPGAPLILMGMAVCAALAYVLFHRSAPSASPQAPAAAPDGPPTLRTRARPGGLQAGDMLVVHELRRDRRVPIVTQVTVKTPDGSSATGTSREISAGGMSMQLAGVVKVSQPVQLDFILPPSQSASIHAVVWWRKGDLVGVRFDYADESRLAIKTWLQAQATQLAH